MTEPDRVKLWERTLGASLTIKEINVAAFDGSATYDLGGGWARGDDCILKSSDETEFACVKMDISLRVPSKMKHMVTHRSWAQLVVRGKRYLERTYD